MKIDWHLVRQYPHTIKNKVKAIAKSLWSFFYFRVYLIATLVLILMNWIIVLIVRYRSSLDQVVLHYNVDFGVDLYGQTSRLFIIPLFGLLIFFVNMFVVSNVDKHEKFIIHSLLATAAVANLLLLISQMALYFYNLR